jgi:adenylate cyclase
LALTVNQKVKLKITQQFILAGVSLGIVYIFFEWGFSDIYHYVNGIAVGLLLGLLLSLLELYFFSRGAKKVKFIWLLALRTLLYSVLIIAIIFNVVVFSRMIREDTSYLVVVSGESFQTYLLGGRFIVAVVSTLIFAFSINFVRMISRKMGQGMLVSYISGTYYTPVHQARIIMFVNVIDSRKIVHELGSLKYHSFLNELFYDITSPVISNGGIIYEYVEDLMVISWAMDKGINRANCIRTYFEIKEAINQHKEKYLEKYGFIPDVQAALHTGSVVRAEIGEIKTQIVFHGDTMNTTARILKKGSELQIGLLVSDQLIHMIGLPPIYARKVVGEFTLTGKQEPIELTEIFDQVVKVA